MSMWRTRSVPQNAHDLATPTLTACSAPVPRATAAGSRATEPLPCAQPGAARVGRATVRARTPVAART